ncbi:MAG: SAM-dependent methyltransferase [Bryobacteraceae bacterium]
MDIPKSFLISPIGYVHSTLKDRSGAPRQGWEGAPNARLEIHSAFSECLDGIQSGQDIWIFTWLYRARRSVLKVHPRGCVLNPLAGVFATRSPDRPNPIGLHRAKVLSVDGDRPALEWSRPCPSRADRLRCGAVRQSAFPPPFQFQREHY